MQIETYIDIILLPRASASQLVTTSMETELQLLQRKETEEILSDVVVGLDDFAGNIFAIGGGVLRGSPFPLLAQTKQTSPTASAAEAELQTSRRRLPKWKTLASHDD